MALRLKGSTSGVRQARNRIIGMQRRSADFRSVFRWARKELEEANRQNFASQGLTSGRPWPPLSADYAGWKLANYGPLPTLIRTGDLYKDLTFLRGKPNSIGLRSATFGTNLPYAKFHQAGTRDMPRRRIVFAPDLFAQRLGRVILNYVVYNDDPGGLPTGQLRRLFRR